MKTNNKLCPYWEKMTQVNAEKALTLNEEERTVAFYAAVWGNRDGAGDILYKGCCAKSIREHGPESNSYQKILMLAYHQLNRPIGLIVSLYEDDYGLLCNAKISKTQDGDEVIQLIKDGVINQFSIGYQYIMDKLKYDEEADTWHVYEIRLYEVSAVSIGANELTHAKNDEEHGDELRQETEVLLRTLDASLALKIRQLMKEWYSLGTKQPINSLSNDEPDDAEELASILKEIKESLTNN